jgi:hypothetical protein
MGIVTRFRLEREFGHRPRIANVDLSQSANAAFSLNTSAVFSGDFAWIVGVLPLVNARVEVDVRVRPLFVGDYRPASFRDYSSFPFKVIWKHWRADEVDGRKEWYGDSDYSTNLLFYFAPYAYLLFCFAVRHIPHPVPVPPFLAGLIRADILETRSKRVGARRLVKAAVLAGQYTCSKQV